MKMNNGFRWLRPYLEGLIEATQELVRSESEHFEFFAPAGQEILAEIALPAMENIHRAMGQAFQHTPQKKIRIEVYPNKEAFSAASTLSLETLERSGAIGICKFHRLMILSPKALPMGYRWLDALSHEYVHLMINELSYMEAELWIHEGTARYFETVYRATPPVFLSPRQKSDLLVALDENRLVSFERMSPSLVYLKDQDEVSLAFSQVSYSVSHLVADKGEKTFVRFLMDLRDTPFDRAFKRNFGLATAEFEKKIHEKLATENWPRLKGAMNDNVVFYQVDDNAFVGAAVQDQVRLGDRMRMRSRLDAALIQYERALQSEPDNGVILLKAARMLLQLNRVEEAVARLRHAVETNPNYLTPHVVLAPLVAKEEAQKLIETALAINPFDPQAKLEWE
jgi:tetratricopeptide (TPR) repeat protein